MVTLRRIVVPTDLSLHVLHVEDVVPPPMYATHLPDFEGQRFRQRAETDARRALDEFCARRIDPDLKARLAFRIGDPVDEIIRFAEAEQMDLIVMATHGRTGLQHVLMGSIAEKVVRVSPVPVLTVKPHAMREKVVSKQDVEDELHIH